MVQGMLWSGPTYSNAILLLLMQIFIVTAIIDTFGLVWGFGLLF